jgi:hypoxanthine phosphoribosyltransferase
MEEFIVDCSENTPEERHKVYNWLFKTRDYDEWYLQSKNQYPIIVCNFNSGDVNYNTLENAKINHPNHPVYTFEQFKTKYLEKKDEIMLKEKGMKELMLDILEKTYSNSVLREGTVPLFMSPPGIGKTTIIKEFAQLKGVKMLKMTLSQRMPNEVVGMMMPNVKSGKLEVFDSYELDSLKDGDILFIDEVFNGTLKQTLDAFLNLLEDRTLPSGKKMADIMIIGASNPQGLINLTPQIKERFIRYDLKFCKEEYQVYLKDKYGMPESISSNLCILIAKEKFEENWNYHSPRSIEKAIKQIGCELESAFDDVLLPYLKQEIEMPMNVVSANIKKNDKVEYLTLLKLIVKSKNNLVSKKDKTEKLVKIEN